MGFLFNRPKPPASQAVDTVDGIRVTQPVLGQPIPIVMGQQRLPFGLLGYTDFHAQAITQQQGGGGGKGFGGGGGNTTTTYNYTATVLGGLCQGMVSGIVNVWGSKGTFQQTSISESFTVPGGGGNYQVGNHANFVNDLGVGVNTVFGYTVNDYGSGNLAVLSGTHLAPLEVVASSPGPNQYTVNPGTGTYGFGSAMGGQTVSITYTYNLLFINETELATVPSSPYQVAVQNNSIFQSDLGVVYFPSGTALTKVASGPSTGQYSVSAGIYQFAAADLGQEVLVTYQINDTTNQAQGASSALNFTLFEGTTGQAAWGYMSSAHPEQVLGYTQLAYIGSQGMQLGPSGELPNYTFEVIGPNSYGSGIVDCDPADCIESIILDSTFGVGSTGQSPFPVSALGDVSQASDFWIANGFFISPILQNQRPASSLLNDWLDAGMTAGFWSEGQLKLLPFGDTSIVGNGAIYTPLNTAISHNIVPDSNGTLSTWALAGLTFNSSAGATQGGGWQYAGTGSPATNQQAESLRTSLVVGQTYTFSIYIDATHITAGSTSFLATVRDPALSTVFANVSPTAGTNQRYQVSFTATASAAVVLMDAETVTVSNGAFLTWSNPQLEIGSSATAYSNSSSATGLNPVVDLDDDDFVVDDNSSSASDPIKIAVSSVEEAYNRIQVQYNNRLNAYNPEIVYEQNDTFINRYGVRHESPLNWDFICTNNAATVAANLRLKRSCYINNTYEFRLKSTRSFLEPMDLVTITLRDSLNNPLPGFNKLPVRLTKIVDDPVKGLTCTAEEFPWGTASATLYPKQTNTPFFPEAALADPGTTSVLVLEVPTELGQQQGNQLKIFCGPNNDTDWGGCIVNLSFDNVNYSPFARVTAPARTGTLATALPAGALDPDTSTLTVNMGANGTLQSVSSTDFAQGVSLSALFNPTATSSTTPVNLSSYYNRLEILPDGMRGASNGGHNSGGDYYSQTLLGSQTTFNGTPYQLGKFIGPNFIPDSGGTAGTWTISGSLSFNSGGGAVSGGDWQYTGTGSASSFNFAYSLVITVVPGQTYTLSAYTDASHVTAGTTFWGLYNPAITTQYIAFTTSAGTNGRQSMQWTAPGGVTQVVALCDTNNATVASGQLVKFSNAQLEIGSTATSYQTTNQLNAVSCTGQTITLPSGKYNSIWFLASSANAANGQQNQAFTVNYSGGTNLAITQSISDWTIPQGYPNEFPVYTLPYMNGPNGTAVDEVNYIYNYDYSLDSTKTVQSITLPNNSNLTIFAITLAMEAPTAYNFELLSYENAALSAGNQYQLTPLHRGLKGTSNLAHSIGETFVRLDEASVTYSYDPSYAGQTIFIKCCSFNTMGGRQQSLAQAATESFVLQGYGPGAIDAVTGSFLPGLGSVPNGSYLFSRTAAHSSYRPTSNPLTAHDAGSSATINVAAFFMRCPGFADISLQSGSITGLSYGTLYYVYYFDLYALGGAVSYQLSTTKETAISNTAAWYVGSILTPQAGAPDTTGFGDGGSGVQNGMINTFRPSGAAGLAQAIPPPNPNLSSGCSLLNAVRMIDGDRTSSGSLSASGAAQAGFYYVGGFSSLTRRYGSLVFKILLSVPTNSYASSSFTNVAVGLNDGGSGIFGTASLLALQTGQTLALTTLSFALPLNFLNLIPLFVSLSVSSPGGGVGSVQINVYDVWIEAAE